MEQEQPHGKRSIPSGLDDRRITLRDPADGRILADEAAPAAPVLSTAPIKSRNNSNSLKRDAGTEPMADAAVVLRAILDNTADGVILLTQTGAVSGWNFAMGIISGVSPDSASGKPVSAVLSDLISSDDDMVLFETLVGSALQGRSSGHPIEIKLIAGGIRRTQVRISVLPISHATVAAGLLVGDMTGQRTAEDASEFNRARLDLIADVTGSITGQRSLQEEAEHLAKKVRSIFKADSCVIRTIDGEELVCLACDGIPRERLVDRITIGIGIAREIIATKKPLAIINVREDRITASVTNVYRGGYEFVPYAGGALLVHDQVVGVIGIYMEREPRIFSESDLQHLQIAANHIAVTLYNHRLYEETQRQKESLEREVLERMDTEEALKLSLKEKDVLLKEVHHRVKNNMQIISSLLRLQMDELTDPVARNTLAESQHRVRSMALVHEKLYHSSNLASIDFAEYLHSLASGLFKTYGSAGIHLHHDIASIRLGVDTAIPCGLIVNELLTNAFKHAFGISEQGQIFVAMRESAGSVELEVGDDGIGIPESLDFRNTKTLGLQLVISLVDQLSGRIELLNRPGTTFRITFAPGAA